ncbi:MAG: TRAM domain-containing protein, partial [Candidatus Bipolaricaulota bacterium]
VQKENSRDFNDRYLDRTSVVLVEGRARGKGLYYGKNEFNKTVTFPASRNLSGEFVTVEVREKENGTLTGILKESVTDDSNSHVKSRL